MATPQIQEEHLIPSQISSYQFRLVGDMTLKQFSQIVLGAIFSLIFYSTPLHPFIKWPLVIMSFLFGVALAFFKIEDRPLAKWIGLFIKAVYHPTQYYWKKTTTPPIFFQQPKAANTALEAQQKAETKHLNLKDVSEDDHIEHPDLDKEEASKLAKITSLFKIPTHTQETQKPENTTPVPAAAPMLTKEPEIIEAKTQEVATKSYIAPNTGTPINIPQAQPIKIEVDQSKPAAVVVPPKNDVTAQPQRIPGQVLPVTQTLPTQKVSEATIAQFSLESSPPAPPEKPNTIVGQVLAANGKILESALLEIKDKQGRIVRALKTNKAGHFIIVTPLTDGDYQITTEKEGFTFKTVEFVAKGAIIPPILIRSVP